MNVLRNSINDFLCKKILFLPNFLSIEICIDI